MGWTSWWPRVRGGCWVPPSWKRSPRSPSDSHPQVLTISRYGVDRAPVAWCPGTPGGSRGCKSSGSDSRSLLVFRVRDRTLGTVAVASPKCRALAEAADLDYQVHRQATVSPEWRCPSSLTAGIRDVMALPVSHLAFKIVRSRHAHDSYVCNGIAEATRVLFCDRRAHSSMTAALEGGPTARQRPYWGRAPLLLGFL